MRELPQGGAGLERQIAVKRARTAECAGNGRVADPDAGEVDSGAYLHRNRSIANA